MTKSIVLRKLGYDSKEKLNTSRLTSSSGDGSDGSNGSFESFKGQMDDSSKFGHTLVENKSKITNRHEIDGSSTASSIASTNSNQCCECSKGNCSTAKCDIESCCYILGHPTRGSSDDNSSAGSVRSCVSNLPSTGSPFDFATEANKSKNEKICFIRSEDYADSPCFTSSNWMTRYSRKKAQDQLSGRSNGTFLIRPSSYENKFALSIVANGQIHHCLINITSQGFGFSSARFFPDLLSLVLYYSVHSLKEHNSLLDVNLKKPVNRRQPNIFTRVISLIS